MTDGRRLGGMSVGARLGLGFGSLVVLCLVLVVVGVVASRVTLQDLERTLSLHEPLSVAAERARVAVLRLTLDLRAVRAGDAERMAPALGSLDSLEQSLLDWDRLLLERAQAHPDEAAEITAARDRLRDVELQLEQVESELRAGTTEVTRTADDPLTIALAELESLATAEEARLTAELDADRGTLRTAGSLEAVLGIALVAAAAIFAVIIWRSVTPPLRHLTRTTERVAEGDLSARAQLDREDEIGQLADTFDTMTERLESTIGELSQTNARQAEYIEQVKLVTDAAESVEADEFELSPLERVAARSDALGVLARSFQQMALEVKAREEALRARVRELRIEIDEARQSEQVSEITDTDYFRSLRGRAERLRAIVRDEDDPKDDGPT